MTIEEASVELQRVPRPDVSDIYAVHGVFRDSLGAAPELVGSVAPGDAERVALVANYYENILFFLEAHHDGEEKLVFPLLRERCAGEEALMDHMDEQHHEGVGLLDDARNSLAAWTAGDAGAQNAAQVGLAALHAQLVNHLDEEEANLLPLAANNCSPEEWGALPGHGFANFHGDKIWLILGLIRERMSNEQRAAMLEHMPPPAVDMWTGFGEQAFKDYPVVVGVGDR
jgi:hypothetical protein